MVSPAPPSLHPFLRRTESGDVVLRWRRLLVLLVLTAAPVIIAQWAVILQTGRPVRMARIIVPLVIVLLPQLLILYFAKRRADGKRLWQFSLSALFVAATLACLVFAVMGIDRRADLEREQARLRLTQSITEIVGTGTVHINSGSLIQVNRASFNDDDLRSVLTYRQQLEEYGYPIKILDLSGTSVTDQGLAGLKQVQSLTMCFLNGTAVTDAAVDMVDELPKLFLISFTATQVTPERLLKLSQDRPKLKIEPQTFRKLKW